MRPARTDVVGLSAAREANRAERSRGWAVLALLNARTYKRDKDGKFASTGGGDGYVAGADLLAGDTAAYAEDRLRVVRERTAPGTENYGPHGNERGYVIAESQGFHGKPEVATAAELDAAIAGGAIEMHRHLNDGTDSQGNRRTAAEFAEQFRSGSMFAGTGMYGNGTYTFAASGEGRGSDLRMALRPDAKLAHVDAIFTEHQQWLNALGPGAPERELLYDVGHYAAARGVDALEVPGGTYIVLNRTAVIVQEA